MAHTSVPRVTTVCDICPAERAQVGRAGKAVTPSDCVTVLQAASETAAGLHETAVIDKQTMRRFDESCLTPVAELTAREIRAIREHEQVSQSPSELPILLPLQWPSLPGTAPSLKITARRFRAISSF